MSRSDKQWKDARSQAKMIRSSLIEAIEYAEDWPVSFDYNHRLDQALKEAVREANVLIGMCSRDWDE